MSTLYVDNLQPNLGSRVMAAGHVVQVVQEVETASGTVSGGSWQTIMTASITPTSTSSKIIITCNSNFGNTSTGDLEFGTRTLSSVTGAVQVGAASGIKTTANTVLYLDGSDYYGAVSPSWTVMDTPGVTSSVTYSLQVYGSENQSVEYNRQGQNSNAEYSIRGNSGILLMEIAQ